jgi:hypothetical protein
MLHSGKYYRVRVGDDGMEVFEHINKNTDVRVKRDPDTTRELVDELQQRAEDEKDKMLDPTSRLVGRAAHSC